MRRAGAVAAILLIAACGGGGDDDDAGVGDATPTTDAPTTQTVDAAAAPFCDAFGLLLVGPLAEGGFDPGDPEALADAVEVTAATVDVLRASAPPEIAEAATAIADSYAAAFAVLETYGYDLERVEQEATPSEQATLDAFGRAPAGPDTTDPYGEVEAFIAGRCAPGVTIP